MNTRLHNEIDRYRPAILLDRIIGRRVRRMLTQGCALVIVLLVFIIMGPVLVNSLIGKSVVVPMDPAVARTLTGIVFLLLGPTLVLFALSFFYNTLYYRGLTRAHREDFVDQSGVTSEVAAVCIMDRGDLTATFFSHPYGTELLARLGMPPQAIDTFLVRDRIRLTPASIELPSDRFMTLFDLGMHLYTHDEGLRTFLFEHAVTDAVYEGSCAWVDRVRREHKQRSRWWSRDALGRFPGIGGGLSLGIAYALLGYARPLVHTRDAPAFSDSAYAQEKVEEIELTLTHAADANVLLVGDSSMEKTDLLVTLARRMHDGESPASLMGKRIVCFDTQAFLAAHPTSETNTTALREIFVGAAYAGNIVVVIEHFVRFVRDGRDRGLNVLELMGPYLASSALQFIVTADSEEFHTYIETDQELLRFFGQVHIEPTDLGATIRVLEDASRPYEQRSGLFFTYPGIARIVACADQYLALGVMPEKAIKLLTRVASQAEQRGERIIVPAMVDRIVSEEIGMPLGPLRADERAMLLNLESVLHARVVGQQAAVSAIAGAMRRARAGIESTRRPIGSFLFLGSTGVGKTETAKALAALFFGSEERMVRFDMSEYSGPDALTRLIGARGTPGMLASALREHPYAVLLLDEFEKASVDVHDLFLQVLDEGVFTDGRGMRVNARNTIIIATSNAGSALIWNMVESGRNPNEARDEIIDAIIAAGTFRPELINRFDATVMFESLDRSAQESIARHMLDDLAARMKQRGFGLVVDESVVPILLREGYDPEFGARPMRRAIQDLIEETIAEKIIRDGLVPGNTITVNAADLTQRTP